MAGRADSRADSPVAAGFPEHEKRDREQASRIRHLTVYGGGIAPAHNMASNDGTYTVIQVAGKCCGDLHRPDSLAALDIMV